MTDDTPGRGHNNPPEPVSDAEMIRAADIDIATLIEAGPLTDQIAIDNFDLTERSDKLTLGIENFNKLHPVAIEDDMTAAKATDFCAQLKAHAKKIEERRKVVGQPFLDATKAINGLFAAWRDPIVTASTSIERKLTAYLQRKAAAAKAKAEEDAKIAREAAEKAAAEALASMSEGQIEVAAAIDQAATRAERIAEAKPAEHSRTRGSFGGVSSLRQSWDWEVEDFSKVPDEYKAIDQVKVNAAIKAGVREIPGARIFQTTKAVVR